MRTSYLGRRPGFGRAADGAARPALHQAGSTQDATAVHRLGGGPRTWARTGDGRHRRGRTGGATAGGPRVHGRVRPATGGRGTRYGEPV
ncbi:hypothetical protein [Streptomyces sp. NPDC052701]|uniref:hypothetical protein n=1 Tax=Streptomyces sp. NPDC052701 TaxID=3155533 RepID=UPI00343D73D6